MALQHSSNLPMMQHSIWLTTQRIVGPTFWASFGLLSLISMGYSSGAWAMETDRDGVALTERRVEVYSSIVPAPNVQTPNPQQYASSTLLFVNPYLGDDGIGNGSQRSPLRTLTRALAVAESGTVVMLAPGRYNEANGEQFPIQLKSGVTVQGDPSNLGDGVMIQGGGWFLSPTFARQDVTLLGADEAVLLGVTVTNPNSRGYGLWIESTSPTVTRNTFSHNIHDGVSITGDSRSTIQGNHFYRNGANGVTIYGTSQPNIQGNVFEETGFGINMGQQATPRLVDNRIWNNRSGIVIQGEARPLLRRNVVEFNEQDGLVAIAQSQPNLGLEDDPGQNRFSDNGQSDINAEVAVYPIISIGNTLDLNRVIGQVRTTMPPMRIASFPTVSSPSISSTSLSSPESLSLSPTEALPKDSAPLSDLTEQGQTVRTEDQNLAAIPNPEPAAESSVAETLGDRSILRILAPVPSTPASTSEVASNTQQSNTPQNSLAETSRISGPNSTDSVIESDEIEGDSALLEQVTSPELEEGAIEIPIIFPGEPHTNTAPELLAIQRSTLTSLIPTRAEDVIPSSPRAESPPSAIASDAPRIPASLPSIAIAPTPEPSRPISPLPTTPPENLLPVPGTLVPEGHLGNLSTLPAQQTALNTTLLATVPFNPTSTRTNSLRYRVLVDANTYEARSLVSSMVPDAFFTQVNGRPMMQIGAYNQLDNANDIAYQLVEQGLQVEVQRID